MDTSEVFKTFMELHSNRSHFLRPPVVAPTLLPSPFLNHPIPKGTSGKVSIHHRMTDWEMDDEGRHTLPVIGARQAFLRGIPRTVATIDEPRLIHELREDGAVWMTDSPEELFQIYEALSTCKPAGRVVVGGLGLGALAIATAWQPGVTRVDVVERNTDVIKLVWGHVKKLAGAAVFDLRIYPADIYNYLRREKTQADCYLLDTWAGTGEQTWWDEVVPMKRIIRNRWGMVPKVHCWAEDIMQGQVGPKLMSSGRNWNYAPLPPAMSVSAAKFFMDYVGAQTWEIKYGKMVARSQKGA